VDFLAESGQRLWQLLPLNPTGYGNSPYSSPSAFAGNPLLIDIESLVEEGLLDRSAASSGPAFPEDRVDYEAVAAFKYRCLDAAWERFRAEAGLSQARDFVSFCRRQAYWLDDYALFISLKRHFQGLPWTEWPSAVSRCLSRERSRWEKELRASASRSRFVQYLFAGQWERLRHRAAARGVALIGDVPIFVSYDSADVWRHRELFLLDSEGRRLALSGAPPKPPRHVSQIWGNPLYDWKEMGRHRFRWWRARLAAVLGLVDILRIDHFSGFYACWHIPPGAETSAEGEWERGPGLEFFRGAEEELGPLPVIAEAREPEIHSEVERLMDELGYAGVRGLQFAFDGNPDNYNLPENYPVHCSVTTGTHDDDTIAGWYLGLDPETRRRVDDYLGPVPADRVHRAFMEILCASAADTVVIPLQDVLGLGSGARMNRPGVPSGQWEWRARSDMMTGAVARGLKDLAGGSGRLAPASGG